MVSTSSPSSRPPSRLEIFVVSGADLAVHELHDILHLRVDVFVVEQACPYPEIDGRDLQPDTSHLWLPGDHSPPIAAYLRILTDPDRRRIGRVVTHPSARGDGLASLLMEHALVLTGSDHVTLDAQSYLTGFYAGFGFEPTGPEYVEDGIPHVPMARAASGTVPSISDSPNSGVSS